jgi:hypothetical protein
MQSSSRLSLAALVPVVLLAAGACATADAPPPDAPAPNVVTVRANDYAFDAPAEVPSGMTTFRLINDGPGIHHLIIVRIDSGKTFDDLLAAFSEHGPPPAWAVMVGGPNAPEPMTESNATLDLQPGNYGLICMVDVPGGVPHIAHGMSKPFTVTPAAADAPVAPAPTPDIVISLFDYNFKLSAPITAGRHTFEVRGEPGQLHEIELVRLNEGKSAQDLINWVMSPDGPPPGSILGGTAPAAPGLAVYFDAEMTPGKYAFICFLPDFKDGKPHFMHGMLHEFTIE